MSGDVSRQEALLTVLACHWFRAVVDVIPSPYDTEALPLHAGDLIGVIHKVLHEILKGGILST